MRYSTFTAELYLIFDALALARELGFAGVDGDFLGTRDSFCFGDGILYSSQMRICDSHFYRSGPSSIA